MQIKTITWLTIFSIAMGYMEAAVVIYLREIYYPEGFRFPLVPLDVDIGIVEIFREVATIIMLAGVGILSAQKASLKFAAFIFCFAVWDLWYYLFLWIFIGWPESLFTWDILFLIPVPWVGPVITPCIISITMLVLALSIMYFQNQGINTKLKLKEWLLLIFGSLVVILSFIWDYLNYTRTNAPGVVDQNISGHTGLFYNIQEYIPTDFNWPLFATGEGIILIGIFLFIYRKQMELPGKNL